MLFSYSIEMMIPVTVMYNAANIATLKVKNGVLTFTSNLPFPPVPLEAFMGVAVCILFYYVEIFSIIEFSIIRKLHIFRYDGFRLFSFHPYRVLGC